MGTVKKAGKAGARSVANRSLSTSKERSTPPQEATKEATRAELLGIGNDFRRGLALLAPGAKLDEHVSALPSHQLASIESYYHSAREGALISLGVLGKLLAYTDARQLDQGDVSAIGWLVVSLTQEAESGTELGDFAAYALSKRNGGDL
jgi:hypothetical protein